MVNNTNTGGLVFPNNFVSPKNQGMILRDYFAAKAMLGLLSDSQVQGTPDEFAFRAYAMADAMLKEKNND